MLVKTFSSPSFPLCSTKSKKEKKLAQEEGRWVEGWGEEEAQYLPSNRRTKCKECGEKWPLPCEVIASGPQEVQGESERKILPMIPAVTSVSERSAHRLSPSVQVFLTEAVSVCYVVAGDE